jgi:hypothetical protein
MAGTLGDLKSRIIDETNRDDLADDLLSALNRVIADAIDYYAAERWWFTEVRTTSTCTIGNEYLALPSGVRLLDRPFLLVNQVRYPLAKRSMEEIEQFNTVVVTGQPTDFAVFGSNIRLWPWPAQAYTVVWLEVPDATALDYGNDNASNVWTLNAAPLLAARSKIILYRDYLSASEQDPRIANAMRQEQEAYSRLRAETNRRLSSGRIKPSW